MTNLIKGLLRHLPFWLRQELKKLKFRTQINRNRFRSREIEFPLLDHWVAAGDWALDIGANVGHYTVQMARLVGPEGRVIAFEPVPATFELLASNTARFKANVTLMNVGVGKETHMTSMSIPKYASGLDNYYKAHMTDQDTGLQVMCMKIDEMRLPHPVAMVKIDAEGCDWDVLKGMCDLLQRDRPTILIENRSADVAGYLQDMGYRDISLDGSHNAVFIQAKAIHRV
jgi:FkbM family methyltransferase